jgi:hypothetical protein
MTAMPAIGTTVSFYDYDFRGRPAGVLSGVVIGYVGTRTMRIEAQVTSGRQVFRRTSADLVT